MKKITLLLVAVFMCSLANAQLVTTSSFTKVKEKTIWYVKAGANFSNMSFDDEEDIDASAILGYNIGIAFDKPIGHRGWFWNSGLQLARKGFKWSDEYGDVKLKANKIELPLTIGYKINAGDDLIVDLRVGGFINYDLWGKMTEEYDDGDEYSYSLSELADDDEYDYVRFGGGITGAIGVWYQRFNLNLCYQYGLVDAFYFGGYERNFMISLGYAF